MNNFARSFLTWNLALDGNFGPRASTSYCNNCIGTVRYNGGGSFTNSPSLYAQKHLSAVTTDLRGLISGGTQAQRVSTQQTGTNNCLGAIAAFSAGVGISNKRRVGVTFTNWCGNSPTPMVITAGKTSVTCESCRPPLFSTKVARR